MSKLDAAIDGVLPVTPPAPDPNLANPQPEGEKGGKGRTPDEVRGELLRKQDEAVAALRAEISAGISSIRGMVEGLAATKPAPAAGAAKGLEDMSVAELRAMRQQIPADQPQTLAALDAVINDRAVDERVSLTLKRELTTQKFVQIEQEANEAAMSRWPELRDKSTQLYKLTNRLLNEAGDLAETDPRAVLNAANEAGIALGLTPKGYTPRPAYGRDGRVVPGRDANAPAPGSPGGKLTADQEANLDRISRRLGDAMPNGRFTPEQLARIKERSLEYMQNTQLLTNG